MSNRLEMVIPLVPPSINSVGRHWSWKLQQTKKWGGYLMAHRLNNPKFGFEPESKRYVGVTIYWPHGKLGKRVRLPDDDNVIAGFKPARDLLKKQGFIREDNPRWSEFEYKIYPAGGINWAAMNSPYLTNFENDVKTGWTVIVVEDV